MARWEGATPLMAAAWQGMVAEATELLAHHANPHLRNQQGLTALGLARSRFWSVPYLLEEL